MSNYAGAHLSETTEAMPRSTSGSHSAEKAAFNIK